MTFEDAMKDLRETIDAAVKAAGNEDGVPGQQALKAVQADIESIDLWYEDAKKLAGLTNA